MRERLPAVYILCSKPKGTLYTGVTSNLVQRVWQHREQLVDGFSKEHHVDRLVYFEMHATMLEAITREKRLKAWKREWKVNLIEQRNPSWRDLWAESTGGGDRGFLPAQE